MANNPQCSFLASNFVYRMNKQSTKCRMVFMSNLSEKSNPPYTLSHNQISHHGYSCNQKLTSALLHLRFGEKMLTFDAKKAFCQIGLREEDANRLLFLWYRNPLEGDFTLQAWRNIRLSFGLKFSPCILLAVLYKILVLDSVNDAEKLRRLKCQLYALLYMDNFCITADYSQLQNNYS